VDGEDGGEYDDDGDGDGTDAHAETRTWTPRMAAAGLLDDLSGTFHERLLPPLVPHLQVTSFKQRYNSSSRIMWLVAGAIVSSGRG
jgi:hypothetical protein